MTYQFKDAENQVTIQNEFNTLYHYRKADGDLIKSRTIVALLKYRVYQKTALLRETLYNAALTLGLVKSAPLAFWLNTSRPVRRAVAVVRHYVGLTRAIRDYRLS